jgi:acyl transferase domain-containing protein
VALRFARRIFHQLVDIRVETPICGFSLGEYARSKTAHDNPFARILWSRAFGCDPWCQEPGIPETMLATARTVGDDMSVAFLFPGQGSQTPGMLRALPDHPAIVRTLDEVSESLGANVLELDSAEALQSVVSVQLALLASGVAVARALVEEGIEPEAVAGLSVGAFAAAVQSGVISLSDSVHLVQQRAEMMVELYPKGYGLAAIIGLTERQVSTLVEEALYGARRLCTCG